MRATSGPRLPCNGFAVGQAIYFNSTALQYWAAPFLTSLGIKAGAADADLLACGVGPAGSGGERANTRGTEG